jgi:cholesterol transport system auxiliary component
MRRNSILALAGLVAACGPIVQIGGNNEPPPSLLTLSAEAEPVAAPQGEPILVEVPLVPGELQTLRVPVETSPTEIAYLKDANWIEQPNQLFQRLLAETLSATTGRPALVDRNTAVTPAQILSGRLESFGLDVSGSGAVVRVRFDAVLSTPGQGFVGAHRFEAEEPVASETGPAVARSLNKAANAVALQVAEWIAQGR